MPLFEELGVPPSHIHLPRGRRSPIRWPRLSRRGHRSSASSSAFRPRESLPAAAPTVIVTMGVVTTPQEARGRGGGRLDVVVASGFEAGGHRASFMRPAESSLTGTFALVPQVVDAVKIPGGGRGRDCRRAWRRRRADARRARADRRHCWPAKNRTPPRSTGRCSTVRSPPRRHSPPGSADAWRVAFATRWPICTPILRCRDFPIQYKAAGGGAARARARVGRWI